MRPNIVWRGCFAVLAFVAACTPPVHASPQSQKFVDDGVVELNKKNFLDAAKKFTLAIQADPKDASAIYFQGVALNRLASPLAALAVLRKSETMGVRHESLDFEIGWSLVQLRQWSEAVPRLEKYEREHPGRAQTQEFLGRAYAGLKQYDKADAAFKIALERDAKLKPTIALYQFELERRRGNREAAGANLVAAAESDTPLGRALREQIPPPEPNATATKPWSVGLAATFGYNDNVIALGNTVPLPSDISRKGASFERLNLNAQYEFRFGAADSLVAGYALLADSYNGLSAANLIDNYFYADYRHSFSATVGAALRVSDEETRIGGMDFRSQQAVRPALGVKFSPNSVTEFAFQHAHSSYKANVPTAFNRTGDAESIQINHAFQPAGSDLRVRVGYTYTDNRSDSTDFNFTANSVSAALAYPLFYRITGQVAYTYSEARFSNANTLSPVGAARNDDTHGFSVQLARPLNKMLSVFLQYSGTRSHSNIPLYSYDQNVTSIGLAARF